MVNEWRARRLVVGACAAFLVLTLAAMLLYPGGTFVNPNTRGYLFLENFFSDLGMTRSFSGEVNRFTLPLFVIAMFCAGSGLILFFSRFAAQFPAQRALSYAASVCGVLAGVCFFGIALTPQDLFSDLHDSFSAAAFLFLLLAALMYAIVLARTPTYPKKYAFVFAVLAALLWAYVLLFFWGPPLATRAGMMLQATGQKIIVLAAIVCLLIQTRGRAQT
jgi:hypothetical protein